MNVPLSLNSAGVLPPRFPELRRFGFFPGRLGYTCRPETNFSLDPFEAFSQLSRVLVPFGVFTIGLSFLDLFFKDGLIILLRSLFAILALPSTPFDFAQGRR